MVRSDRSSRPLTYEDYCKIPNDGLRHEIVAGVEIVGPAPNLFHQAVSRRIQFAFYSRIELAGEGQVLNAPVDVQLGIHDIVQPDLMVVFRDSEHKLGLAKIDGPPDLVIEILSPSTRMHDLHRKRRLYERAQVPEYWIVDPDAACVQVLVLVEGCYQERARERVHLAYEGRPGVRVELDLAEVFRH